MATTTHTESKRLPRTRTGNMIGTTHNVVDYWVEQLQTANASRWASQERGSMSFRGDTLSHYGWWPLATGIRVRGVTKLAIVNGDVYGGSGGFGPNTESRRMSAERALRHAGIPFVILPFSAMRSASIVAESVRIVESQPARTEVVFGEPESLSELIERRPWLIGEDGKINLYEQGRVAPIQVDGDLWRIPRLVHRLGESVITANVIAFDRARRKAITRRNVRFLSGFDAEDGNLYFLCELPRGCKAETVVEAYEALKPEPVKAAMIAGVDVKRQGDIFAIPTSLRTRDLTPRKPNPGREVADRFLLDSTHTATEVRERDGETYARGILRHEPHNRARDHRNVKLGDGRTWYRILKNTVPASFDRAPRAWTINGRVD